MKNFYSFLILAFIGFYSNAQIITFPDVSFKNELLQSSPEYQIAKDLSGNFFAIDANNDGNIQVSEALQVSYLDFPDSTIIADITGIENFTNLRNLHAPYGVTTVNLNGLVNLQELFINGHGLTSLDVSHLTNLIYLNVSSGTLSSLHLGSLPNLLELSCSLNEISSLDVSGLPNLKKLFCDVNSLTTLDVSGLSHLEHLQCNMNLLTSLNVSGATNLIDLYIQENQILSLDLTGLVNLTILSMFSNSVTSLDLSGLTSLIRVECGSNQLTSLTVTNLPQLEVLFCDSNQLTTLDLSGLTGLKKFMCENNQLTGLDTSSLVSMEELFCSLNHLTSLDLSTMTHLENFSCTNNQLTTLNIKNGANEVFNFLENPIQYICADDNQVAAVQAMITNHSIPNCHVNTYCSFTPGGTFYTIQGASRFDQNNNGCDATDINFPNLKFSITNGSNTGTIISDNSGNYTIPVQAGLYTITPIFENPGYFSASPASISVNFPTETSPFLQNFCITPIGVYNDLEIILMPLNPARPGFDVNYKIIYKNKGTGSQSGSVNMVFNDEILDLVSAVPATDFTSTNNLSWNFSNLHPFETREILVTLNLNSPMENPAVNDGDHVVYSATVNGTTGGITTANTTLNQNVVNSFDPNDKTCLEGNEILPGRVGEYVRYIIRFENTGTFAAENIVVKDMIDTAKFDITSLVPLHGSHEFATRINGNRVEFLFENINLPFDDAHNDGYVAFKIKTNPTLVLGDTFSNSASIYFDYNFPIVTDPAVTTIQALANADFDFGNYFSIYPNPAGSVLNLETKAAIGVKSINVYNMLGQMIIAIPNAESIIDIDVSDLRTGTYFIKVTTDKGTANTKFIKQ